MGLVRLAPPGNAAVVTEIGHPVICQHAYFQPDQPLAVHPGDYYELFNGQWWLIRNGEASVIEGKWKEFR